MMLLDTNVLSELMRPIPDHGVEAWIGLQPPASLFISTITEAELRYGVALMPNGRRRDAVAAAIEGMMMEDFHGRILAFDSAAAIFYAQIAADRRAGGRPITPFDAQIAAIARSRGATLATRNVDDFEGCGVEIVNPWSVRL